MNIPLSKILCKQSACEIIILSPLNQGDPYSTNQYLSLENTLKNL